MTSTTEEAQMVDDYRLEAFRGRVKLFRQQAKRFAELAHSRGARMAAEKDEAPVAANTSAPAPEPSARTYLDNSSYPCAGCDEQCAEKCPNLVRLSVPPKPAPKFSAGDRVYWRYVRGRDRLSRGVVKWATPDIVFLTYPDLPTLPGAAWAFDEIHIYHSGAPDK